MFAASSHFWLYTVIVSGGALITVLADWIGPDNCHVPPGEESNHATHSVYCIVDNGHVDDIGR